MGAPLISQDNQPLGQLDSIMVDLPAGQVVYLVVKPSVGGDPQRDRYVLPPSSVKRDASGQTLVLKADQAHFVAGPHFQPEFWVDMSRPELAAAVREHYPTQASTADPTRQPVRARLETPSSVTAPAASDEEITRAVKRQIMSALALDAEGFITQGIKVKTVNGRVTLTGHLKNEKEKQQVVTAAERAAGAGRVDDQLEPRTK